MSQNTTAPRGEQRSEGFGSTQVIAVHETATSAVAKQSEAEVNAMYIMALRRPRNYDMVRTGLLRECERSTFAATATYRKPVGKTSIEGLSVRFAEAAMRSLGNLAPKTRITFEDDDRIIAEVSLTDLESNLTFSKSIMVKKTVERRKPRDGQEVLGERTNTSGEKVYIVRATEDEVMVKFNSQESKILRNHTLRILDAGIQEECRERIRQTVEKGVNQDPDAERKRIVDAFASLGVKPADLMVYLKHDLDRLQPAEVVQLRQIYTSIRDGESVWEDWIDVPEKASGEPGVPGEKQTSSGSGRAMSKAREAIAQKRAERERAKGQDEAPREDAPKEPEPAKTTETKKQRAKAEPEKLENPEHVHAEIDSSMAEGLELVKEAYTAAKDVMGTIHQMNKFLGAAELPVAPFDKWSKDELVWGLYLMNEVVDLGQPPTRPNPPFWMEDDAGKSKAWLERYQQALVDKGLVEANSLL